MTTPCRIINYIVLCALLTTSCAHKRALEESYTPSPEVVHAKSDTPIVRLWDRWNESSGDQVLVGGSDVVSAHRLPRLLADDPSPEVAAKVKSAETWHKVGAIALTVGLLTGLFAALGYTTNKEGERAFSIPAINSLWITTGAMVIVGGVSLKVSSNLLDDAQSFHNDRIWKQACGALPPKTVEIAVRVPF